MPWTLPADPDHRLVTIANRLRGHFEEFAKVANKKEDCEKADHIREGFNDLVELINKNYKEPQEKK